MTTAKIVSQGCIEITTIGVQASETARVYHIGTTQKYPTVHLQSDGLVELGANEHTLHVAPGGDRADTVLDLGLGEGWVLGKDDGRYGGIVVAAREPGGEPEWVEVAEVAKREASRG